MKKGLVLVGLLACCYAQAMPKNKRKHEDAAGDDERPGPRRIVPGVGRISLGGRSAASGSMDVDAIEIIPLGDSRMAPWGETILGVASDTGRKVYDELSEQGRLVWTLRFCSGVKPGDISEQIIADALIQLQCGTIEPDRLTGPFRDFCEAKVRGGSNEFRMLCSIDHATRVISIHKIGPRENFLPGGAKRAEYVKRHSSC